MEGMEEEKFFLPFLPFLSFFLSIHLNCYWKGFTRPEVDAQRPEFGGAGLLGCATENVLPPGELKILKTDSRDDRFQLCFQQSAGNSAGPQVDVFLCLFRDSPLNHDVANLDAAPWLEHSVHLLKDS